MNPYENIAKILIIAGGLLVVGGLVFFLLSKLGGAGWRLPGDIFIERGNFKVFFPLATCILLSIVLTILFNFIGKR